MCVPDISHSSLLMFSLFVGKSKLYHCSLAMINIFGGEANTYHCFLLILCFCGKFQIFITILLRYSAFFRRVKHLSVTRETIATRREQYNKNKPGNVNYFCFIEPSRPLSFWECPSGFPSLPSFFCWIWFICFLLYLVPPRLALLQPFHVNIRWEMTT